MPVQANAQRLLRRVKDVRDAVAHMAPYKLVDVAVDAIAEVSNEAMARLSSRDDQVGFDLNQFLRNIEEAGPLMILGEGRATIGILDQIKMGTVEDFERIAHQPGMFHNHTGDELAFREVYDHLGTRESVARARRSVWGERTPQWYLLEYGYAGDGAYPPVPAANFISAATRNDRMALLMRNAMSSALRGIPRR